MLPIQIERRLEQPKKLEQDFINYLLSANCPIDNSKTIATNVLYHGLEGVGSSVLQFFTGQFVQNQTNIVGQFIRPQSEHFLIYGIRGYYAQVDEAPVNFLIPWQRGFSNTTPNAPLTSLPQLINATIDITTNGVLQVKNLPLAEFNNDLTTKDRGSCFLDQPIVWEAQTSLILELNTNDTAVAIKTGTYIRFDLVGLGLV